MMCYASSYIYLAVLAMFLFLLRKYRESKWGKCRNNEQLDGKVAIVTGANSGIGFEIAKELASRNSQVIVACRTLETARTACAKISSQLPNNPTLVPMELNLASLKSIKQFADEVEKSFEKVHLLVNNAGVSQESSTRVETVDNFEIHMGVNVNYIGPFYLTQLLRNSMSKEPSRIIVMTSLLHILGEINLDNLNREQITRKNRLYSDSMLARVYFAQELARHTKVNNINVYSCCPGWAYTGLFRHRARWYHYILGAPLAFFFMKSAKQAAQTSIYCATESSLENETGLMYRDCKPYNSGKVIYGNLARELRIKTEQMIIEGQKKCNIYREPVYPVRRREFGRTLILNNVRLKRNFGL